MATILRQRTAARRSARYSMSITIPMASRWCRRAHRPTTPPTRARFTRAKIPDFEISFAVERAEAAEQRSRRRRQSLRRRLSESIPRRWRTFAPSDGFGARNGRDMLTALWPATLGYFLNQMMASVFTPAQIEMARQYVLANAIPRGPLPAMSVGKTPYGVLPVTSLQALSQRAHSPGRLART